MNELVIRSAHPEDLPGILELYKQPEVDDGRILSLSEAERIFDRFKQYPDYRIYVACLEERIVGSFTLVILDNLGHMGAKSGLVEDVVVSPERQGRGIGSLMMEFAVEECRAKKCYKMALSSATHREKAHRFYEKLGFERHGYSFQVKP